MISKQVTIVLVRPQYPFNIGATARAMQNMGFERLVLVAPACEIDVRAREGAASAQEVLARRETYNSLTEFYKTEGEGIRVAFTRREGGRRPLIPLKEFVQTELSQKILNEWDGTPIYLMFGSEDHGLSTEELEFANRLCLLPTHGKNGSFNLAQAVLIALFIINDNLIKDNQNESFSRSPIDYPKELVEKWLETIGFNLDNFKRRNASTVINSMLLRAAPDKEEVRVLSFALHQCIRKLNDMRKLNSQIEGVSDNEDK